MMSTPSREPEEGGTSAPAPWGAHQPGLPFRGVLRVSRMIPQLPLVKQLAFLLRRMGRSLHTWVDVHHWGLRLRLRTSGNISEGTFLFMPRRWDPGERAFLARHLRPGSVFVDVGANAGGYLWWLQRVLGSDWRGLAVEPDPELRGRLRLNLDENGMGHVRVVAAAVGPAAGRSWIEIDPRNRGENVLVTRGQARSGEGRSGEDGSVERIEVRVVPLPELLEEAGLATVDALKIDVEGLEPAVLEDFLDRAPDQLLPRLLLTELPAGSDGAELLERLEDRGYRVELRTRLNVCLRKV